MTKKATFDVAGPTELGKKSLFNPLCTNTQ